MIAAERDDAAAMLVARRRARYGSASSGSIRGIGDAIMAAQALDRQAAPRAKGPPVWLDMDQQALDDAYDQEVYAPNRDQVGKRRIANSEKARAVLGAPER